MVGIYKITNKINGKVYIGQSVDIEARFRKHRSAPFNPTNNSYFGHFYSAIRKYSLDNFSFEILEECTKAQLDDREKYWIAYFDSYNPQKGYNETKGGQGTQGLRTKLTEEQVQKIYKLLQDTSLSQTEIAKQFGVSQRLISGINSGTSWHNDILTYPLRVGNKGKNTKKYCYCIDCGAILSERTAQRCMACARIATRVVKNRPSHVELKNLIRTTPFTTIAEQYGVSDTAIRKWCQSENLPSTKTEIKQYTDEEWELI